MFEYCYPRLDANVTKGMNHLLKSPFSIHPKTGRVSIPIDSNLLGYFDPCKEDSVPKLKDLCQQVEQLPKQNEDTINTKQKGFLYSMKTKYCTNIFFLDYNQTSLKPFIDIFARFAQRLQTSKQDEILAKSGSLLFFNILFFNFYSFRS
jgi:DNA primase small subunit